MIMGLFNETAKMAAEGKSGVYAFQFGNELYYNVETSRSVIEKERFPSHLPHQHD